LNKEIEKMLSQAYELCEDGDFSNALKLFEKNKRVYRQSVKKGIPPLTHRIVIVTCVMTMCDLLDNRYNEIFN